MRHFLPFEIEEVPGQEWTGPQAGCDDQHEWLQGWQESQVKGDHAKNIYDDGNAGQVWQFFFYTSQYFIWWDFGGMTIQDRNTGGIDPNCHHPKPRPTTPQDFVDSIDLQYRKETC